MNEDFERRISKLETQIDYVLPKIEKAIDTVQVRMNEQFELLRTAIHDMEREDRGATCPKRTDIAANAKGLFEVREEIERVEKKLDDHIAEPAKAALEQDKDDRKNVRNLVIAGIVGAIIIKAQDIITLLLKAGK